jgi:hypothetical protein
LCHSLGEQVTHQQWRLRRIDKEYSNAKFSELIWPKQSGRGTFIWSNCWNWRLKIIAVHDLSCLPSAARALPRSSIRLSPPGLTHTQILSRVRNSDHSCASRLRKGHFARRTYWRHCFRVLKEIAMIESILLSALTARWLLDRGLANIALWGARRGRP